MSTINMHKGAASRNEVVEMVDNNDVSPLS
jgi:hypothetical protein